MFASFIDDFFGFVLFLLCLVSFHFVSACFVSFLVLQSPLYYYWIPKLPNNSYRAREIWCIASSNCSTKELSIYVVYTMIKMLSSVKQGLPRSYCDKIYLTGMQTVAQGLVMIYFYGFRSFRPQVDSAQVVPALN